MTNKVALYDIIVSGEGALTSEEIPAGQPIPAKYKDKIEGWEARGLLTEGTATEAKAVADAEKEKEEAQKALLEAQQKEAVAQAELQKATENALEGVADLTSATQQATAQKEAVKTAQTAKKPAGK